MVVVLMVAGLMVVVLMVVVKTLGDIMVAVSMVVG